MAVTVEVNYETLRQELKKAPERVKLREIRAVLRAAARATVNRAKAIVPVRSYSYTPRGTVKSYEARYPSRRKPGNLRRAINVISGRDKENVTMYAGVKFGPSQKHDGWYAHIVHSGGKKRKIKANPFMELAHQQTGGHNEIMLSKNVAKAIAKSLNRLNATAS
jgi:HK97 gp10 family phage protein